MSDIVAEIRGHLHTMAPHQRARLTAEQLRQAADEIERLRNQVEQLRSEAADARKWAMSERGLRYDAMVAADEARRTTGHQE